MLLSFTVSNYKSFKESNTLSMVPAPKQKGLDYSICKEKIGKTSYKALCSTVMYGPNASGKTNIIGAMDTFRAIVLRGNIRNSEEQASPNAAAYSLELIPNKDISAPVTMAIEFIDNCVKYKYEITLDIGLFLEREKKRKILSETFYVNNVMVFQRGETIKIGNLSQISSYLIEADISKNRSFADISEKSLLADELFLTGAFKLLFAPKLVQQFTDWISEKFMVIYHANEVQFINRFADPKEKTIYIDTTTQQAAKLFGINSNGIGYFSGDDGTMKLCSVIDNLNIAKGKGVVIQSDIYESYGTLRFVNIFPLIIRALDTGSTLVIDEFDASIHPIALMNIINIFHNDEVNTRHAQLIFNTHNPIFLNSNMFRRDEIKFVERDDTTHESSIYALSDFGTSGKNAVRKGDDYMKNYFVDQYGAINNIDFTDVIKDVLGVNGESSDEKTN